jgi:cell division protein FtsI (penicillin-binding protein 3)
MKPARKMYIRLRTIIVGIIFALLMGVIGARAVYLQIYCGSWLSQKAATQYEKSYEFHGKRGTIYDINLREMAVSVDGTSIGAYPRHVVDRKITGNALGKLLKIDVRTLDRKLSSKRSFIWIKRKVTPRQAEAAKDLKLKGIDFIAEHSRFYPNKTLAAQVLGFTGTDGNGLEGIEYNYDQYLRGATGNFTILADALGRGFGTEKNIVSNTNYSGNNIVLTIDRTVQYIAEQALEKTVTDFSAKSGIAVVMRPRTGAVLALAHFPFFNPNAFRDFGRALWRNRAITDPFEPGSTLKIFSAAAAIESGACKPDTIFFCENGEYRIGNNVIHDATPRGWLSLQQIVKYSSNIGAVKVSEILGPEYLYNYLRKFGFGKKTGIDCPGETVGSMAPYKRWSKIDTGAIAFGQGISVSAIQLITAACTIANDGIRMKPFIVQAITNQNGRLVKSFAPKKVKTVISAQTARSLRKIMKTVVSQDGTGVNAALEGYSVCGKTGTAQKSDENGTYAKDKYMASFIGFAPAEKAAVAILVVIDEPRKNHYGGVVAAPAFKKIASETLNYLNIPPKRDRDKLTAEVAFEASG